MTFFADTSSLFAFLVEDDFLHVRAELKWKPGTLAPCSGFMWRIAEG